MTIKITKKSVEVISVAKEGFKSETISSEASERADVIRYALGLKSRSQAIDMALKHFQKTMPILSDIEKLRFEAMEKFNNESTEPSDAIPL